MQTIYSDQPYYPYQYQYYISNSYTNSLSPKASSDKSTQSQSQCDFDNETCIKDISINTLQQQQFCTQSKKVVTNPQNSKYKIQLCRNFKTYGSCPYGTRCQYAHGQSELRFTNIELDTENNKQVQILKTNQKYKTKTCREFFKKGFCSYGQTCNYLHSRGCSTTETKDQIEFDQGFLQIKMQSRRSSRLMQVLSKKSYA